MAVKKLQLSNLSDYDDGLLAAAFDQNLKRIIEDLNDRPTDDRVRKLYLEIHFEPEADRGDLDRVKINYKCKSTLPTHEGRENLTTPKRVGRDLNLVFAEAGTDAEQPHLPLNDDD